MLFHSFLFFPSPRFLSAPCALLKCDFYAECKAQLDGSLECVCPRQCPLSFNPVCGSDGQTYPNECTLRVESCRVQTRITLAKRGQCGAYSFYTRERTLFSSENDRERLLVNPAIDLWSACLRARSLIFIFNRCICHYQTNSGNGRPYIG